MVEPTAVATAIHSSLVHIVDDDSGVRASLEDLLASVGYEVGSYGSTSELLADDDAERPDCLILEVRLPGMNGLEFQEQLAREGRSVPVILVTGHGDVPMSVLGMKAGAIDFIEKPFREQDLLDAVVLAIEEGRRAPIFERREDARQRFATLSRRERGGIKHVIKGQLNKQIALNLSISEVTIKVHRVAAERKLGTQTLVELTRLTEALGI